VWEFEQIKDLYMRIVALCIRAMYKSYYDEVCELLW